MESPIKPLPGGLLKIFPILIIMVCSILKAQVEELPYIPLDSMAPGPNLSYSLPEGMLDVPNPAKLERYPIRIIKPDEGKKFSCRYFNIDESKKYTMQIINPEGKSKSADSYGFFKKYYKVPQIPDSIYVIPEPEQLFKKFREKR